jgi:hypothetical protein
MILEVAATTVALRNQEVHPVLTGNLILIKKPLKNQAMTEEKHILYPETTKLIEKEDLRVNNIFWFIIGFLSAAVLILIIYTSACIPF